MLLFGRTEGQAVYDLKGEVGLLAARPNMNWGDPIIQPCVFQSILTAKLRTQDCSVYFLLIFCLFFSTTLPS